MEPAESGEQHTDDELATALEAEVARITAAVPTVGRRAEPLDVVPEALAPRDSQPVPVVSSVPAAVGMPAPEHEPIPHSPDVGVPVALVPPAPVPPASPGASELPVVVLHEPPAFVPEATDLGPTRVEQRAGHASRMFWLWFAATSSFISVGVGATLFSLGLSLRQLLVATLVGVALSFLPLGLGTLAGKWSGQPTMVVSRATFGVRGNLLPVLLALLTKLFWGAVLLWLAGSAAGSLAVAAGWTADPGSATATALAVAVVVAGVVAFFGFGLLARVQLALTIASATLAVILFAATWRHVDFARSLSVRDAFWTHVITGAIVVFSYLGLAWAMSSAEVARYQRRTSSGAAAMLWATFGAGVPPFAIVSYGGVLAASDPAIARALESDPVRGIIRLGMPSWYAVPLLLAIGLSLISALVLTIYSAGFTLEASGVRLGRRWSTAVVAIAVALAGAGLAMTVSDLSSIIRGVTTTISVPVAAWAGLFAGEMMLRTRRFHHPSLTSRGGVYPDWRWINLGMLVVATAIGLGMISSTLAWLDWEGYLFRAAGIDPHAGIGASNIGVAVALVIGLVTALSTGLPAVRRQERAVG